MRYRERKALLLSKWAFCYPSFRARRSFRNIAARCGKEGTLQTYFLLINLWNTHTNHATQRKRRTSVSLHDRTTPKRDDDENNTSTEAADAPRGRRQTKHCREYTLTTSGLIRTLIVDQQSSAFLRTCRLLGNNGLTVWQLCRLVPPRMGCIGMAQNGDRLLIC